MKLIVGLGNPGKEYEHTRHNAGFLALDELVKIAEAQQNNVAKIPADIFKGTIGRKRILAAKPRTFMNNSGMAVRALVDFYKIPVEDVVVVHDDKDIPLGELRVHTNRGPAGHNGVKSVIEHLGTQNFTRIRIGIATTQPEKIPVVSNYVLSRFTAEEKKILQPVIKNAVNEVEKMILKSKV